MAGKNFSSNQVTRLQIEQEKITIKPKVQEISLKIDAPKRRGADNGSQADVESGVATIMRNLSPVSPQRVRNLMGSGI